MKTYKANRKGFINYLLLGFLILPVVIFVLDVNAVTENPLMLLPILFPFLLVFWIYLDTSYKIGNGNLLYRSGFIRGKIEIAKIREIVKGKTTWVGLKPALAKKGLLLKFNKYDELYIAPEYNDEMIADLLSVNPQIQITE